MSIQPFVCLGAKMINHPGLNAASWMAQVLWTKIYQSCDLHWRFSDDPEEIRGVCFAKCSRARVSDIAHCLSELKSAGLLLPRAAGSKCWVEVPIEFRHRANSHRDPRYGIGREPEEAQGELPLGPVALSPPPKRKRDAAPITAFGQKLDGTSRSLTRVEKKRKERVLGGNFTRPLQEDFLLEKIGEIAGKSEVAKNGGMWRMRIRHCAKAVGYALEDWKLLAPDRRRSIKNPAAWLTDAHARALVAISQEPQRKLNQ